MNHIYLDYAATYPMQTCEPNSSHVLEFHGNPSSIHGAGDVSRDLVERARRQIAASLSIRSGYQVVFTSGGTESNNLALLGTFFAKNFAQPNIVIGAGEHASILMPTRYLAKLGVEVRTYSARCGVVDLTEIAALVDEHTILISAMHTNNETGAIHDVRSIFDTAKQRNPRIICHCDAVGGYMKSPISMAQTGAHLLSISAHKIAPIHGTGALIVANELLKSKRIVPLIHGGGQECGLRSGTENVAAIAQFGAAVNAMSSQILDNNAQLTMLKYHLMQSLPPSVQANIPDHHCPHIISLTLPKIRSEVMVNYLSSQGIYVANGSACHSTKGGLAGRVSHALLDFGLTPEQADCTIRISLAPCVTTDMIDTFVAMLNEGIQKLVRK